MVEQLVGQCYECQVTTREHRQEPLKRTEIPEKPWQVVSVDFGGPYPDGHYNLVVIDKRTRYPEVETLYSTAVKPTKEKLKKVFATYGTPEQLETDNSPPFHAKEFAEFAVEEGFRHHRITPLHPRANGEAENFMKLLNKTEQRVRLENKPSKIAIQELLIGYRSTPHPATGTTPYDAMMNRKVRTAYIVHKIRGSTIWARRVTDGREVCRNSTFFKFIDQPRKSKGPEEKEREKCSGEAETRQLERRFCVRKPTILERDNGADEPNRRQKPEQVETIPRRSHRIRQKPNRYGDFIYYN